MYVVLKIAAAVAVVAAVELQFKFDNLALPIKGLVIDLPVLLFPIRLVMQK